MGLMHYRCAFFFEQKLIDIKVQRQHLKKLTL